MKEKKSVPAKKSTVQSDPQPINELQKPVLAKVTHADPVAQTTQTQPETPIPAVSTTPAASPQPGPSNFYIPVAIVIAGALIGTSIFLSNVYKARLALSVPQPTVAGQQAAAPSQQAQVPQGPSAQDLAKKVAPITAADHIRGPQNAPVTMIEFSDLDCPYCDAIQPTLKQLQAKYGSDKVAWVYRHLPLTQLHPTAQKKAEATECVADQGGNDMFWKFVDKLFENQQKVHTDDEIATLAAQVGANKSKFKDCLTSGKNTAKVSAYAQDAGNIGARGTPYVVIVSGDKFIPISGAYPIETFTAQIDPLLK